MPACLTEIVVTSQTGNPAGIAADLVAQAEHDPEALAVLITSNAALAEAVKIEVKTQSQANAIAKQSLAAQGFIFVTASVTESRALTNRLAPEHLTVDSKSDLKWVQERRLGVYWRLFAAVDGRLHLRAQPCVCRRDVSAAFAEASA